MAKIIFLQKKKKKKTHTHTHTHTHTIAIRKIKPPRHTVVVSASLKPHRNQWLCSANKFCFDERFDVKVRCKIG